MRTLRKFGRVLVDFLLEDLSGLDFFPELPSFIQQPIEADRPNRLWPIRWQDLFRQIALRFM